jgi:hypothetical protein
MNDLYFSLAAVVDLAEAKDPNATKFFEEEYQLDHLIATLDTPFVSIMDGITSKSKKNTVAIYMLLNNNDSGWWCWLICTCSFPYCY